MSYKILIVDDSSTARFTLAKNLGLAEIEVAELLMAENGTQALELVKAQWVDLMFVDINMPEMNGIELIQAMAEADLMSMISVIVVSTEGSEQRIDELRALGIKGYLRKPIQPENLREIVDYVLEAKHGR